jgi:hypothetical protein
VEVLDQQVCDIVSVDLVTAEQEVLDTFAGDPGTRPQAPFELWGVVVAGAMQLPAARVERTKWCPCALYHERWQRQIAQDN